jgi:hypothetical protein
MVKLKFTIKYLNKNNNFDKNIHFGITLAIFYV